jgi:hypothetical protein
VLPEPESILVGESDPMNAALKTQGTSDELTDIEKDLNATDLGSLDAIDAI